MSPAWLPGIVKLSDHGNDWDKYLAALYQHFCDGFMGQRVEFDGLPVHPKRLPIEKGKEATFWHIISEGKTEADRTPNMRRCERILWPRAFLDNQTCRSLRIWQETVKGDDRVHIFCESAAYLLVLAHRGTHLLVWTGYPVDYGNQTDKLIKRWKTNR